MSNDLDTNRPWYAGVTRYQWLVLLIASLGWIFDVFEGQVFVASMPESMESLLPDGTPDGEIDFYSSLALASFLIGGALGGIGFGMLSDRIGRTKTMVITILMYSLFTCVTAFSLTWYHMVILRFLVAMGIGGEWAVASAMVAEVFPARARARAGGVFHASSVFGTYLAAGAGVAIVGNPVLGWRWAFAIGAAPALLTLWVRWKLREPEQWVEARKVAQTDRAKKTGNIADLFRGELLRNTLVGVSLATIGLATFWGAHICGKDLLRNWAKQHYLSQAEAELEEAKSPCIQAVEIALPPNVDALSQEALEAFLGSLDAQARTLCDKLLKKHVDTESRQDVREAIDKWLEKSTDGRLKAHAASDANGADRAELSRMANKKMEDTVLKVFGTPIKSWDMLGMLLVTTGGGIGLISFGPICERIGRRHAFVLFHIGGLIVALVLFQYLPKSTPSVYYLVLPIFGFLTLGMHAGYAIYFPELFPTRLRGTGGGFCFNGGRILAAPVLFIRGWMRDESGLGYSLETTVSLLSLLFLLGIVVALLGPETKGRELPE